MSVNTARYNIGFIILDISFTKYFMNNFKINNISRFLWITLMSMNALIYNLWQANGYKYSLFIFYKNHINHNDDLEYKDGSGKG